MKTEYSVEIGSGKHKEVIVFEAPDGLSDKQISELAQGQLRQAKPGQTFAHPIVDHAEQTHIDTRPKAPAPKPDTSLGHNLAVGAKGVGLGLLDTANALNSAFNPGAGISYPVKTPDGKVVDSRQFTNPLVRAQNALAGSTFGTPQTSGQNYLQAGTRGVAGAAPFALAAPAAAIVPTLVSGGTSGISAEAARRHGFGPVGQFAAGLVGGVAGGVGAARVPGLRGPTSAAPPVSDGRRVYEAAQRLGGEKHVMPADVGGTPTKMATAVSHMTLGGIPLAEQSSKNIRFFSGVRDNVAQSAGGVASDSTGAGQALQRGAKNWMDSSEKRAGDLYDAIPIPGAHPSILEHSKQALASLTTGLRSNSALSALIEDPRLKAFAEAFTGKTKEVPTGLLDAAGKPIMRSVKEGGGLSWEDLKAFRSYVGEKAGSPSLQSDTSQKALKSLYGALSEDMQATAAAHGPKSLSAFNRANQFWRGRQDRIENVIGMVLGKDLEKGSTAAFEGTQRLTNVKGGDPIKLGRLLRSMSPDEADTARATVIQRMGLAKAGVQNARGEAFSPSEFVTQWNAMSGRAKAVLFNKPEVRKSLDDLVEVMGGMKGAEKYANTSKTALAANGVALIYKAFATPLVAVGIAGGELGIGKALSSPIMAKALVNLGRARNPVATRAALVSIANIGTRNPDLAGVARHIIRAANDDMPHFGGQAAASPDPGQNKHKSETDEILRSVAEDGRRQQQQWDEEDRQQQQQELPDSQDGSPE